MIKKLFWEKTISTKKQAMRYFFYAGFGTALDASILYILTHYFSFWYIFSNTAGYIAGLITVFLPSKYATFQDDGRTGRQFIKFTIVALIGLAINNFVVWFCVEYFGWWFMFGKLLAIWFSFVWNFFGHKHISFKIPKSKLQIPNKFQNPNSKD